MIFTQVKIKWLYTAYNIGLDDGDDRKEWFLFDSDHQDAVPPSSLEGKIVVHRCVVA